MPTLPERKPTRLPHFDYRSPGPYAITICTQGRVYRFGEVTPECLMEVNAAGAMVTEIWHTISDQFRGVQLDAFVVLPNHLHGILTLPSDDIETNPDLSDVVGWFKTVMTNRYIRGVQDQRWARFDGHLWQRQYYEHIVRDDADMERWRTYIEGNASWWATDQYRLSW